MGAALLLRRAALDDVGLFDERYFMYSEETDLCLRLARAGWETWFVPAAVVTEVLDRTDEDLRLGAMRRETTVLFSDLRGFTTFSEQLPPDLAELSPLETPERPP